MCKLEGFFDISLDRDLRLVKINSFGFWTLATVAAFTEAFAEIGRQAPKGYDTLCNAGAMNVHIKEVSDELGRLIFNQNSMLIGRCAVILSSTLMKLQIQRFTQDRSRIGYFSSEEEGLVWLGRRPSPFPEVGGGSVG